MKNVQELQKRLASPGQYIADTDLSTTLFLALKMQKPVLLEGPAGVGKTEVAKALSRSLDRPLIRMQCYEGLDESRALYEWEYGKQLLYTQLLRNRIEGLTNDADSLSDAARRLEAEDAVFFSESFLLERPLLQAIRSEKPAILLIDEIDKSDAEFEAFLLELLSDFQVTIPEIGTISAVHRPIVVLTSNQARELGEALKRRCLYYYISYPSAEQEMEIVRTHQPEIEANLAERIIEVVHKVRDLELRKKPSVSETIEWAQALVLLGAREIDAGSMQASLGALLKHNSDSEKVRPILGELLA